jgi:MAF protein
MAEPLVLASASPRRARILADAGFDFEVDPSGVDEPEVQDPRPDEVALRLARSKAAAVSSRHPGRITLGADTVVVLEGRMLGKPADGEDAARTLRLLRDRTHSVITGVAIEGERGRAGGTRTTHVTMRSYTDSEVSSYVASGSPMDKAGAYGVQDLPFKPAAQVDGCYLNVVGLPVCLLSELLSGLGAVWSAASLAARYFPAGPDTGVCPACAALRSGS